MTDRKLMLKRSVPVLAMMLLGSSNLCAQKLEPSLLSAEQLTGAGKWKEAANAWRRVTNANPYESLYWLNFGYANANAGDLRSAIEAYTVAYNLGGHPAWVFAGTPPEIAYRIARLQAQSKNDTGAARWLNTALRKGLRNPGRVATDTALTRTIRRADVSPLYRPSAPVADRDTRWKLDIQRLSSELVRMHVAKPGTDPSPQIAEAARSLIARVPRLNDDEVVVGMMRVAAVAGDGHTGIFPEMVPLWTRTLPVQLYLFGDTVRIIAADSAHASLVGAEIVEIDAHRTAAVLARLRPVISVDHPQGLLRQAGRYLRYPQILHGLGLQRDAESVRIVVRMLDGTTQSVTLQATPTDARFDRISGAPSWVNFLRATSDGPLYLRDRRSPYWFAPVPEMNAVYVGLNGFVERTPGDFGRFTDSLFAFVDRTTTQRLIIDLRWNNGGNTLFAPPLLRGITERPAINTEGNLFVLAGRYTNSAAVNTAALMERFTNVIFFGEPVLASPNLSGEVNLNTLPYSRIFFTASDLFWQGSWPLDARVSIAPRAYVPPTFEDFRFGRDPAMQAIREFLDARR